MERSSKVQWQPGETNPRPKPLSRRTQTTAHCLTFVLVISLLLSVAAASVGGANRASNPELGVSSVSPAGTVVSLSYCGVSPGAISLCWSESDDICFSNYSVWYSVTTSDGPWYVLPPNITTITEDYTYVYGNTPGQTNFWEIVDNDFCTGAATSNVHEVTQPANSTLTFTTPTSTSAQLSWNNLATYGGNLSFDSYQVMESINGGSFASATSISSESTMSYTANGLSPSSNYSFYIVTTDECSPCAGGTYPSPSESNTVKVATASPLSATAGGLPTSVDVGQTVTLTCTGGGGVMPYSYSWAFGDGTSGSGHITTHSYTTSGPKDAVCTVTDDHGTTATSGVSVAVDSLPTVTAPTASPSSVLQGKSVTFTVTATPGSGSLTYNWTGLPPGCSSVDSDTLTCSPTSAGTFQVEVEVTDSNGGTGTSTPFSFTVNQAFLGLPALEGYEVLAGTLGAILVVAGIAAAVLLIRRRKKRAVARGTPAQGSGAPPPNRPQAPPPT